MWETEPKSTLNYVVIRDPNSSGVRDVSPNRIHTSKQVAIIEAERLAGIHPGIIFYVAELVTASKLSNVITINY